MDNSSCFTWFALYALGAITSALAGRPGVVGPHRSLLANSTSPTFYVKEYRAGPNNSTVGANSKVVILDTTAGTLTTAELPFFYYRIGNSSQVGLSFNEAIINTGCFTVNTTSNVSSTGNAVALYNPKSGGSVWVPFSICNGTCSHTTPWSSNNRALLFMDNSRGAAFNVSMRYQAYSNNDPVCKAAYAKLNTSDQNGQFLQNIGGGLNDSSNYSPYSVSTQFLPASSSIVAVAFSNTSCLRVAATASTATGISNAKLQMGLYREQIMGPAFKANKNGGIVYTNAQCSFTSGGNCDAASAKAYSITGMDTTTSYYLVLENQGTEDVVVSLLTSPKDSNSCKGFPGAAYSDFVGQGLQQLVQAAYQDSFGSGQSADLAVTRADPQASANMQFAKIAANSN